MHQLYLIPTPSQTSCDISTFTSFIYYLYLHQVFLIFPPLSALFNTHPFPRVSIVPPRPPKKEKQPCIFQLVVSSHVHFFLSPPGELMCVFLPGSVRNLPHHIHVLQHSSSVKCGSSEEESEHISHKVQMGVEGGGGRWFLRYLGGERERIL